MKWAPLSDTRTRGSPDGGRCVITKMITQYAAVRAQAMSRRASIEPGLIHGPTKSANGGIECYAASDPAGAGSGAGWGLGATGAGAGGATCAAASLLGSTG